MNKSLQNKNTILNTLFRIFHIETSSNESVDDIKANLLKLIVYFLNILGIPVIFIVAVMSAKLDNPLIAISYIVFYIPIFIAFIFRKKITYKLSVTLVLFTGYLIGIGDLFVYGFFGMGIPTLLTIITLTSIFLDVKAGFISIFLGVIPMLIDSYLYTKGILVFDLYQMLVLPASWISIVFLLVLLGSISVLSFGVLFYKMDEKIAFSEIQTIKLEQDIADRKKTEKALKESKERLRKINKTKDKFFSIIAHDLRSPFNTMLGFSNLLVERYDELDNKEQKNFINILKQDIQSTYNLLENLLLWSRSQSDAIDFIPEKENLYLLSIETVSLLKQSAKNKSILIVNNIDESIYVKADKNMLLTILRNLISNAIKFTDQNGQIEINSRLLKNKSELGYVEISVTDNGIGIANDNLDKLFMLSENTSTKGTNKETGTGLGLIICKEFIEKHGGEIWVESEEGKGSKFYFTLPAMIQ
jgi:signal transduction histidine kinase